MKALIRNEGETITEDMGIPGISWINGYPLTSPKWFGGPYTLIVNYLPPIEGECEGINIAMDHLTEETPQEEEVVEDDDYVVINGVRYNKEELRKLIE